MSLNVKTINVNGTEATLRLTSKALLNFNLKHGAESGSPVIAVLEAVNNIGARMDLFTNALSHPENKNSIKSGGDLLDLMADDPAWDRNSVNELILRLAYESGLLSEGDYLSLLDPVAENGKQLIDAMSKLLTGKRVGSDDVSDQDGGEENPT